MDFSMMFPHTISVFDFLWAAKTAPKVIQVVPLAHLRAGIELCELSAIFLGAAICCHILYIYIYHRNSKNSRHSLLGDIRRLYAIVSGELRHTYPCLESKCNLRSYLYCAPPKKKHGI